MHLHVNCSVILLLHTSQGGVSLVNTSSEYAGQSDKQQIQPQLSNTTLKFQVKFVPSMVGLDVQSL